MLPSWGGAIVLLHPVPGDSKKGNPILDYLSARENTSYHNSNIVKSNLNDLQWSVQNMENELS